MTDAKARQIPDLMETLPINWKTFPTARQLLGRSHESKGHGVLSGDFPWDRSEQWGADKQGWVGAHV